MIICRTIEHFRRERRQLIGLMGLVPTMGYLHEGHQALVEMAQRENDQVAVWIFVNPTQFNNPSDLATYPRDEARDLALLQKLGVTLVFAPDADEIYPPGFQTYITVEDVSQGLEGAMRPGHFRGVATVVAKFFNIMQPDRAYFGQKDAQQVAVIRQMVRDLNFPVELRIHPIVRESDGLALSSRNARLTPADRAAAGVLFRALCAAQHAYQNGERHPENLVQAAQDVIATEPRARVEYISAVHADTLQPLPDDAAHHPILLSMAVYLGEVRLIDNFVLSPDADPAVNGCG